MEAHEAHEQRLHSTQQGGACFAAFRQFGPEIQGAVLNGVKSMARGTLRDACPNFHLLLLLCRKVRTRLFCSNRQHRAPAC